jgi:predicted nucleic acid-binding protein
MPEAPMSMVYLDTSVALAHLLGEDVSPPEEIWEESLVSSRLLAYELWNRLDAMGLGGSHTSEAREILGRVATLELVEPILGRAMEGFPSPVRTLDALHLASLLFLVEQGLKIQLASYDQRLSAAAEALGIPLYLD